MHRVVLVVGSREKKACIRARLRLHVEAHIENKADRAVPRHVVQQRKLEPVLVLRRCRLGLERAPCVVRQNIRSVHECEVVIRNESCERCRGVIGINSGSIAEPLDALFNKRVADAKVLHVHRVFRPRRTVNESNSDSVEGPSGVS